MCGIVGTFASGGKRIDPALLEKMTKTIRHRGPSDEGYLLVNPLTNRYQHRCGDDSIPQAKETLTNISAQTDETFSVGLGYRRLSIIDLSPAGHQPISNADGTIWLIFNGEIYNYIELREELKGKGYAFRTKTDTEVIIHAYEEWGTDCLNRFNGMWAFALWDGRTKTLFCARDRFGVKPFYYFMKNGEFAFASEIKALLTHPAVSRVANHRAVHDYLAYAIIDHTDETFFSDIKQLPPSHRLTLDAAGHLTIQKYYTLVADSRFSRFSESENKLQAQKLLEILSDSVKLRMRTDVPLGSCLSGGLDSSTIVCLANSLISKSGVIDRSLIGEHQKTFTAVYDDPQFSEKPFVDKVISRTNAEAHFVRPDGERLWAELRQLLYHQDEPFNSTSVYAQWNVMRLASEHGVTVLLDGQGADELLAGYSWHRPIYQAELLRRLQIRTLWNEIQGGTSVGGRSLPQQIYELLKKAAGGFIPRSFVESVLEPNSLMRPEFLSVHKNHWGLLAKSNDNLQQRLLEEETQLNLQQLLHYEDRNSMAFSIEARVPFIDYRVVECGMKIPATFKIHNGWTKYALRSAAEGIIPKEIQWRRDKMGFVTPQDQWLQALLPKIRSLLVEEPLRAAEFIDRERIEKRFHDTSVDISGNMLWRLVCLEMWMRVFEVQ